MPTSKKPNSSKKSNPQPKDQVCPTCPDLWAASGIKKHMATCLRKKQGVIRDIDYRLGTTGAGEYCISVIVYNVDKNHHMQPESSHSAIVCENDKSQGTLWHLGAFSLLKSSIVDEVPLEYDGEDPIGDSRLVSATSLAEMTRGILLHPKHSPVLNVMLFIDQTPTSYSFDEVGGDSNSGVVGEDPLGTYSHNL